MNKEKPAIIIVACTVAIIAAIALFTFKPWERMPDDLPAESAELVLSSLIVRPAEVEPNQTVTVAAAVQNTGGERGTLKLELTIDGQLEQSKNVTLDGGEATSTSFYVQRDTEGTYSVELGGLTGAFEVRRNPSASDLVIVWERQHDGRQGSACEPVTWISGVIENRSTRPLTPIIEVLYYNQERILIYRSDRLFNYLEPIVPPGGRFPFETLPVWRYEGVDIASYDINISYWEASGRQQIDDVTMTEDYAVDEYLGAEDKEPCISRVYWVNFKIRNESNMIADRIFCGVVYYNSDDERLGATICDTYGGHLPPAATKEVRCHGFVYDDPNMRPSRYEILMSAWS